MDHCVPVRVGPPRFNPAERLLHRFYEPLVLLHILNRTRGEDQSPLPSDLRSQHSQLNWRKLIDDLSLLCDYDLGGTTVTAIAAESIPAGAKFWLAARKIRSFDHFMWILDELKSLHAETPSVAAEIEQRITVQTIVHSKKKVQNHIRALYYWTGKAMTTLQGPLETQTMSLWDGLRALEGLHDNHYELCQMAFNFGHFDCLNRLRLENSFRDEPSAWSGLRHTIGRLGSWHRASRAVVQIASHFPQYIDGSTAEFLPIPSAIRVPAADAKTNVQSALRRMLPANEDRQLSELYGTLENLRGLGIAEEFVEEYCNPKFRPRVHAEMLILEHFYRQDLDFVLGERYIGCSKPSCYCCGLYTRYHPGNFQLRPCHGNVWPNWAPPLPVDLNNEGDYRHTRDILNDMAKHVRRDVVRHIKSMAQQDGRVADSSSGISTNL